jgi:hypothetical protein
MLSLFEEAAAVSNRGFHGFEGPVAKADFMCGPCLWVSRPAKDVVVRGRIAMMCIAIEALETMKGSGRGQAHAEGNRLREDATSAERQEA